MFIGHIYHICKCAGSACFRDPGPAGKSDPGGFYNRPSTDKLHHFVQERKEKNVTCDTWHVTCDTWHVTHGTWHMTCDMLLGVNIPSKFQLPSSYGLWFMIQDIGWRTDWLNHKCVCRTAPATQGLLNIGIFMKQHFMLSSLALPSPFKIN